jgi:ribosome-dependent ATPase
MSIARLTEVSHRYGKTMALDEVSLDIPKGCMAGIIGPDGVGKSTLLGLISGVRIVQQGTVEVLDGDIARRKHREDICTRIAYMPQGLGKNLYAELSVTENLDFFGRLFAQPAKERRERIAALLKATGLDPFPDRPVAKLSGGMKQKLGLCCALLHDPHLMILDEPTTGVDPLSRRQFWELIDAVRKQREDMSVIVSTAYMDEAERFDWLAAMDAGRVLATGSPQEIEESTGKPTLEEAYISLTSSAPSETLRPATPSAEHVANGDPIIVAKDLTRRFGTFTAVDRVSFSIKRGEIFGFLGSNGCGKTTTMKILTGLLPSSEGRAELFGKPVDASHAAARKRVGYMSQSFSLYGELTVRQNLHLHARLFDLAASECESREATMLERFTLAAYAGRLSKDLPLGVRQRLSLAVAMIHQPEILILDEPTSGVDPAARNAFWDELTRISREEGVTIFVSTHFMNEALRCDRICLMHAGKVLAKGTPDALVRQHEAVSLEEAFITCIERAIGGAEESKRRTALPILPDTKPPHEETNGSRYSLARLFAFSYREALELMRDPIRRIFALLGAAILLPLFIYGINSDVEGLRYAVLDLDRTPASRAYQQTLTGSRYFDEQPQLRNVHELQRRMQTHAISVAIEIPPHFGRHLKNGKGTSVAVWVDGAEPARAETIKGYVEGVHQSHLAHLASQEPADSLPQSLIDISPHFRYNPSFESIQSTVPGIPAILLVLIPAILMALSVVREKELGTITNFYVTPSKRLEFIIGKQLPYIGVSMINFAILTFIGIVIFQVPLKGSALALGLGALFYVTVTTGIGLLISSCTSSQVAAVFGVTILSFMLSLQFSGLLQPVSTLEGSARIMGRLWPTTYYMNLSMGAFTKGLSFSGLQHNMFILALFIPILTIITTLALKKQEA